MSASKIIQIIPADGWYAYYLQDDGPSCRCKIACLALTDDGEILFMDADDSGFVDDCTKASNFAYVRYEK